MKQEELTKEYKGFEKIIVDYVNEKISNDKSFEENVLKEVKTVKRCADYINGKAKEQAVNGVACVNDEEVYNWINEYFVTDLAEKAPKENPTENNTIKPKIIQPRPAPKKKVKPTAPEINLFNFNE